MDIVRLVGRRAEEEGKEKKSFCSQGGVDHDATIHIKPKNS